MQTNHNFYATDIIDNVLPKRLKFFRNKAQLTTADVGKLLNKTPSTVTLWEKGKALPSVEMLLNICNLYKISDVNELIGDNIPLEYKKLSRTEQNLIKLWRMSDISVKGAVTTILQECNKNNGEQNENVFQKK